MLDTEPDLMLNTEKTRLNVKQRGLDLMLDTERTRLDVRQTGLDLMCVCKPSSNRYSEDDQD